MPGHAGFAYGFAVDHHGGTDRWFLRLPPPGVRWEGTADMLRQVTALQALDGGDVPHCHVQWYGGSDDLDWFGCPYFVVEQLVDGDVITFGGRDSCGAHAERRAASGHGPPGDGRARRDPSHRLARVVRLPRRTAEPRAGCHTVGPLRRAGRRPDALADVPRLRRLLLERLPGDVPIGLFHGDFQFSNLYFTAAGELRAVLDWELCGIGATLNDVGWVATFNNTRAWQHDGAVPEGMPRADELLADYAAAWGGPLPDSRGSVPWPPTSSRSSPASTSASTAGQATRSTVGADRPVDPQPPGPSPRAADGLRPRASGRSRRSPGPARGRRGSRRRAAGRSPARPRSSSRRTRPRRALRRGGAMSRSAAAPGTSPSRCRKA